ncbi:hypothetical protein CNMCM6106_001566 [Aspergillus hiratsukae]|uniref:Glycoside hydrolase family 5 domain-containing protein n=1 Tax=Aspergillus hiratsukae TaxID=1194566 RepID=A0A8H6Q1J1_9EURO|nr:hypothetical protein CNMCM6106_001566 [Aspergillus hiratsukae]
MLLRTAIFSLLFLTACADEMPLLPGQQSAQEALPADPGWAPPLHTEGRLIVDTHGRRVKLASINWYGASDERFVPGGLEVRHRDEIATVIRQLGFNSVRLPYSDEMVQDNPVIDAADLAANSDLAGLRAMDVFAAVVQALTRAKLMVIINDHITQATWCCGANLCDTLWYNSHVPFCRVRQTQAQWLDHWDTMMSRFVDNPFVIGADLRNEVRGPLLTWNQWASAAERAGNHLLTINRNWLIFVEGYHSADDLTHVSERPVSLDVPNRVVYSSHVYKWGGWGALKMYGHRSWPSFRSAMDRQWGYILERHIAPVWVGEMGTPAEPSTHDAVYWQILVRYLKYTDVDFAYWAINPRKPHRNESESYSLLNDDWTPRDGDARLQDLQALMRNYDGFRETL